MVPSSPWTHQLHEIQYGKGPKDLLFVIFYTVLLSFFRESIMQLILRPLAIHHLHIPRNSQKLARFMEQAYTAIYFAASSPVGLYVMKRSPIWYFQTRPMFEDYPHTTHSALFKAYYLVQAAYWMQQALVLMLQLEKPRKDFKELVAHHLITLGLIASGYRFHFTYMGLAVYIIHDVSDFFLAVSGILSFPCILVVFANLGCMLKDLKSPQLSRLLNRGTLLLHLCRHLDLFPSLSDDSNPLLRSYRVCYSWTICPQCFERTI